MRVRAAMACAWVLGCSAPTVPSPDAATDAGSCTALFGSPNASTGLSESQCRPVCGCGATTFTPRAWTPTALASLRTATLLNPPAALTEDPYLRDPPPASGAEVVCAARFEAGGYRLVTYPRAQDAVAAGAIVSHSGACGVCSPLADLAVYAGTPDLTAPVRACGIRNATSYDGLVACLMSLGFTSPCAQVWAYNTRHTQEACGAVCIALLNAPYHTSDGALNECLACDERESGPVFKAVAGRTRRNSGLANAMCRPCSEVVRLTHAYPGV